MRAVILFLSVLLVACATEQAPKDTEVLYEKIDFEGQTASADERARCEAVGGIVRRAGMAGWEHCIQDMPDAGKTCSDSSDCLSRCVTPPQEGRSYQYGDPATGQCAPTDEVFGCFTEVIDGKANGTLCVD